MRHMNRFKANSNRIERDNMMYSRELRNWSNSLEAIVCIFSLEFFPMHIWMSNAHTFNTRNE